MPGRALLSLRGRAPRPSGGRPRKGRSAFVLAAALAACATAPDPAVPPDPLPSPGAVLAAGALARVTEDVCLAAQRTGAGTAVFVGRAGAASLGLRPAPPPHTGWVTADGPRVVVAERQTACFASLTEPAPGTTEALVAALAAPVGSRLEPERRAAEGALVRRVCRAETAMSVIEGTGPDGRPVLGVAVPPKAVPCAAVSPPVPGVAPEG